MGWSCRQDAGNVLDRWTQFCIESTGIANVYLDKKGNRRMFEVSRTEHGDGAITGTHGVLRGDYYYNKGSFRIEGNGDVSRRPAGLTA
jgi:hypothetical protein